jgi:hypothetical protein
VTTETNKEQYIQLCNAAHNQQFIPVFARPFWLDTVAENWDVALVLDGKTIVAALPYCWKGNFITRRIYLPDLNFYQSILFFRPAEYKNSIALQLFQELPKTVRSYFKFLPEHTDIDLTALHYSREDYPTYLINSTDFTGITSTNHRRNIQKGIKHHYAVQPSNNTALSFSILTATYNRQKLKPKVSLEQFQLIAEIAAAEGCGQLLNCMDDKKNVLASIFIAEDEQTVYYLMGGYHHAFKNTGAMTFLLHHVIQYALRNKKTFNFCGSSKKTIASFFEGFGAERTIIPIWKKKIF